MKESEAPNPERISPTEAGLRVSSEAVDHIRKHWWKYLCATIGTFAIAYLYLAVVPKKFEVKSTVLVVSQQNEAGSKRSDSFEDFVIATPPITVENTVQVLKSSALAESVVTKLQLNFQYYIPSFFENRELQENELPFKLSVIRVNSAAIAKSAFQLFVYNQRFFSITYKSKEWKHRFDDTIILDIATFIVHSTPAIITGPKTVSVRVSKVSDATNALMNSLKIEPTSKTASTIDISIRDNLPVRGEKLLNTFLDLFNYSTRQRRNQLVDSVLSFIEDRLDSVSTGLSSVEKEIQNFRRNNELTDISEQTRLLVANSKESGTAERQQQLQLQIIDLLIDFVNNPNNSRSAVAALNIPDQALTDLIANYNKLQQSRSDAAVNTGSNNPLLISLDNQIQQMRQAILSNLSRLKGSMELKLKTLEGESRELDRQKLNVPKNEKMFLEFSRQQAIRQDLYLYLLKRKEAAAINKSTNLEDVQIIDPAREIPGSEMPKATVVYFAALIFALAATNGVIYLRKIFGVKIKDPEKFKAVFPALVIGEISKIRQNGILATNVSMSPVTEQFRQLQANISFLLPGKRYTSRKVMITSSIRGEGKSFTAVNLANTLARSGKKTLLIEFDLRKPKLAAYLHLGSHTGVAEVMGGSVHLDEAIQTIPGNNNLFFLSAGLTPSDPICVVNNEQLLQFFNGISADFSSIVIDAPPVGVVSDALVLSHFCDLTLYVVRPNHAPAKQIPQMGRLRDKIKSLYFVLNGVALNKTHGYGYGYSE